MWERVDGMPVEKLPRLGKAKDVGLEKMILEVVLANELYNWGKGTT